MFCTAAKHCNQILKSVALGLVGCLKSLIASWLFAETAERTNVKSKLFCPSSRCSSCSGSPLRCSHSDPVTSQQHLASCRARAASHAIQIGPRVVLFWRRWHRDDCSGLVDACVPSGQRDRPCKTVGGLRPESPENMGLAGRALLRVPLLRPRSFGGKAQRT